MKSLFINKFFCFFQKVLIFVLLSGSLYSQDNSVKLNLFEKMELNDESFCGNIFAENDISSLELNNQFNADEEYFQRDILGSFMNLSLLDTLVNDTTEIEKVVDSSNLQNEYIPLSQFMYSDNRRYTMSGDLPLLETKIKPIPTVAFGAGFTAVFVAQHILQLRTLWDTLGPFKFAEDIKQDLWADKIDHFFDAYFASYLLSEVLMECGFSYDAANIWGGVLGLTYLNYIEVLDGFGVKWGFSPSDFYANVAGSLFFVGQHYIPYLQNFTPKFMYFPAKWHGEEPRLPHAVFIDDYSSHTCWLSVNVHNMLPENIKGYWPSWLQLSFGYAARNLFAYSDYAYSPEMIEKNRHLIDKYSKITEIQRYDVWGSPRFIIALDYDLAKILPDKGSFWNWLRQTLMYWKLPSPAVEFGYRKPRYYLVYPFGF